MPSSNTLHSMQIDVFCESGEKYGLGHLVRCQNLITHIQALFPFLNFQVQFHTYPFSLPSTPLDLVVIDSYLAPQEFYTQIQCKMLLCLDDFHRISYPKHAKILSPTFRNTFFNTRKNFYGGEGYVILHPIFHTPQNHQKQRKNHLFINLGGSNQTPLISSILKALKPFDFTIHILNPYFQSSTHHTYANLNPNEVCALLDSCEYVICAGGGGINEAIARGKKIIALSLARNQIPQLKAYQCLGIQVIFFPQNKLSLKLQNAFKRLKLPPLLKLGSKLPLFLTSLIHQTLASFLPNAKSFTHLNYQEQCQILALRNQKEVRNFSFDSHLISPKEHFSFLKNPKPHCLYFAFFENKKIFMVVSMRCNLHTITLGIYKDLQSPQSAKIPFVMFLDWIKNHFTQNIELEVLPNNQRAIDFYKKCKFVDICKNQERIKMCLIP